MPFSGGIGVLYSPSCLSSRISRPVSLEITALPSLLSRAMQKVSARSTTGASVRLVYGLNSVTRKQLELLSIAPSEAFRSPGPWETEFHLFKRPLDRQWHAKFKTPSRMPNLALPFAHFGYGCLGPNLQSLFTRLDYRTTERHHCRLGREIPIRIAGDLLQVPVFSLTFATGFAQKMALLPTVHAITACQRKRTLLRR
jgi:hypothetical protein